MREAKKKQRGQGSNPTASGSYDTKLWREMRLPSVVDNEVFHPIGRDFSRLASDVAETHFALFLQVLFEVR